MLGVRCGIAVAFKVPVGWLCGGKANPAKFDKC